MNVFRVEKQNPPDLIVDAVYQRSVGGADPLPWLLGVNTMGGFRYRGSLHSLDLVALVTSGADPDWPDTYDEETGILTYFGDNKSPGRELHDTPRFGNEILRSIYANAARGPEGRAYVPPIFLFAHSSMPRAVRFLGLAVPGSAGAHRASEDLVGVWRTTGEARFQNYRAYLTTLDISRVSREWITDLASQRRDSPQAPRVWRDWVERGVINPLRALRTIEYRSKQQQLPASPKDLELLRVITDYFTDDPHAFEFCAGAIARLMLPEIRSLDMTPRSRDGGRDAIGSLRLGTGPSSIVLSFSLEAKCYDLNNGVGVKEVSRLISRLRHREFGVLVTTSFVHLQAYQEIKEDSHPIIIITGRDIVELLKANDVATPEAATNWLLRNFSKAD